MSDGDEGMAKEENQEPKVQKDDGEQDQMEEDKLNATPAELREWQYPSLENVNMQRGQGEAKDDCKIEPISTMIEGFSTGIGSQTILKDQ